MIVQRSTIDRRTAVSNTYTFELESFASLTEWMNKNPPMNVVVKDTYVLHVMLPENDHLYFFGHQGWWIICPASDYEDAWKTGLREAHENKAIMDQLRAEGKIKSVPQKRQEATGEPIEGIKLS